jgi:hypothetical protein
VDKVLADARRWLMTTAPASLQNKAESDTQQQRKCLKQVDPTIPDLLIGITE